VAKKTLNELVHENKDTILSGTLLAIDPSCSSSSSDPAFAFFKAGELIESGIIPVDKKADIHTRLREQFAYIENRWGEGVDIVAPEKLRKGHTHLRWAAIIPVLACFTSTVIEVHPMSWHPLTDKDYVKGDEADAIAIGMCLIKMAKRI
jgi:hypothetical protein